ncbi:MAG: dTDP-4-keto-6-deoxy-D-glucose epimerase [Candidatus Omnitrophica bacterium]|nr:dTDP-4-keto-6-deoxy-D-glucose epimerase [Candidatus Omnitrophota bacterium]
MEFIPLKISGAYRVKLAPHHDHRGFLVRTYDKGPFVQRGLVSDWVQDIHSFSAKKGTVRGLHLQLPPHAETKLVRAGQGRIFMALLDLRAGSPTLGSWDSVVLSVDEPELLYAPKGLAMGMCTLTDNCSLLYKMDEEFHPESARTIRWDDPEAGIRWPLNDKPILSDKDMAAPTLKEFLASEGELVC